MIDLFIVDNTSPLIDQEPLITMRELGLIHTSNAAEPTFDENKVLRAIETETQYQTAYVPLPAGVSDPGKGPYRTRTVQLSGHAMREGEKGPHFRITWTFNVHAHMIACQAEELED